MAQETQYAILMYNFGIVYSAWQSQHSRHPDEKRHTRVHAGIADVTHCGALDHVADGEAFDRLVLGDTARAVGAAHKRDVSTTFLVAPGIPPFLSLSRKGGQHDIQSHHAESNA